MIGLLSLDNENEFNWRSLVTFIQLFKYSGSQISTVLSGARIPGEEKIRRITFPIHWVSKVAQNGRFLSKSFVEFEEPTTKFEPLTEFDRARYGIKEEAD